MSRFQRARSWPGLLTAMLIGLVAGLLSWQAEATPWKRTHDRVNATILSGNPNGTYLYIAAELPNWQRFEPATKWLCDNRIAANSGNRQLEKQFMEWRAASARLTAAN